jgi:glycosyltransferase involved in cell wall biosynthesis
VEIAEVAQGLAPGIQVEALTNGVDTERFQPSEGGAAKGSHPRRLIVPRRLFPKNGVEYLVQALPRLREAVGPMEVRLVGDGPERDRLAALAQALGVSSEVHFLGARPHHEMPELLRWAEVAVFPSLMEATSVAALEAMATGLPVAASRVGGLPEIVDEEVGTLFPPGDPDALARALAELLSREDLGAVGRRARERVVHRWSNRRLATRHLEIYEDLARKGAS